MIVEIFSSSWMQHNVGLMLHLRVNKVKEKAVAPLNIIADYSFVC